MGFEEGARGAPRAVVGAGGAPAESLAPCALHSHEWRGSQEGGGGWLCWCWCWWRWSVLLRCVRCRARRSLEAGPFSARSSRAGASAGRARDDVKAVGFQCGVWARAPCSACGRHRCGTVENRCARASESCSERPASAHKARGPAALLDDAWQGCVTHTQSGSCWPPVLALGQQQGRCHEAKTRPQQPPPSRAVTWIITQPVSRATL